MVVADLDWMRIQNLPNKIGCGVKKNRLRTPLLTTRDERTVIFCDPDPILLFQNSVQVQLQSKLFLKLKVQIKSKKLTKYSF